MIRFTIIMTAVAGSVSLVVLMTMVFNPEFGVDAAIVAGLIGCALGILMLPKDE